MTDRAEMRENGFFIIQTDDGDRYYREIYAKNEMVYIASHSEEADQKLKELYEKFLLDNQKK